MSRRIAAARVAVVLGLGPILLSLYVLAQGPGPQVPVPWQGQITGPFPDRGERCPGHGADGIPLLTVSDDQTNVPEFNDCQRFIIGGKYSSLYAVFAHYKVKGLLDSLKGLECRPSVQVIRVPGATPRETTGPGTPAGAPPTGGGGILSAGRLSGAISGPAARLNTGRVVRQAPRSLQAVATENVDVLEPSLVLPADCRATTDTEYNGVGIAFAEVVSWGGTYDRLGIEPNYNCLYLYDSAALKAIMVPVDMDEKKCGSLIDPVSVAGTRLHVRVTKRKGMSDADYPPVARWDVNPITRGMYIGMACAPDLWCEIGPRPKATPAGIAGSYSPQYGSASADTKVRRVLEIKGWYDEQQLAILDPAGKPVPSGAVATLIPDPNLDSYTLESFVAGTWLPAATIVIRRPIAKYKHSMNLDASISPPFTKVNKGFLCRGLLKECIPDPRDRVHLRLGCLGPDKVYWYSRFVSVKGSVMHKCIGYYEHQTEQKIPGTVRWAWFDTDEGGWWRCPNGCCYPE